MSGKEVLPASWTSPLGSNGYVKVVLPPTSAEFVEVVKNVSIPTAIKKIERVENVELYLRYQQQKAIVKEHCPADFEIERMLFHGTPIGNIESICENGFEKKRIGQTTGSKGSYGSGIYFSPHFVTSKRYCGDDPVMLYCNVVVGEWVVGTRYMPELPFKPHLQDVPYDSAVDHLTTPGQVVIFEDSAAYPAYILHFG